MAVTRVGNVGGMARAGLDGLLLERSCGIAGKGRDLEDSRVDVVDFAAGDLLMVSLLVINVVAAAGAAAAIVFVPIVVVAASEYLSNSSPIFALRRLVGIRLMRRSMRDRRSEAWRA